MTREDPTLLPICQFCGEYKGVGICKNPTCSGSKQDMENEGSNKRDSVNRFCSVCKKDAVVFCVHCGRGFCLIHNEGVKLNRLESFHQHLGTCVECKQVVCEKCWILNPNGDIVCLAHLEETRETR
jgi:hypothetical protein